MFDTYAGLLPGRTKGAEESLSFCLVLVSGNSQEPFGRLLEANNVSKALEQLWKQRIDVAFESPADVV